MNKLYRNTLFRTKYAVKTILALINECVSTAKIDPNLDLNESIIFMLACDYNNIGDALIRESQIQFLERYSSRKVYAINYGDTFKYLKDIKKRATEKTIIALTGGGDTDDRYTGIEISGNRCKIIGFPQTIDYSNSNRGRYYKNKTMRAYAQNKNFIFTSREKKTYGAAKKLFSNKILLTPDIVFSHRQINNPLNKREGIGLLLRKDEEINPISKKIPSLLKTLNENGVKIDSSDMTVSAFNKRNIKKYIKVKIEFAKTKKLVITDRLHGMILCYITNTPCIVFPSCNHKIIETYNNWLNGNQNFIYLVNEKNISSFQRKAKELLSLKNVIKKPLDDEFSPLIATITKSCE